MYVTLKEEVEKQLEICGKIAQGHGKCKLCGCKKAKRGMVIHHRWYITNDVVYKNYPQNDSGRLQYYKDLEPLIRANPMRFSYQCNADHHSLSLFIRYGDKKFNALSLERKLSKKNL